MKQFLIFDHFLNLRDIVTTDVSPRIFDCITPQKTTIDLLKGVKVEESDIVLIRDINKLTEDYLGIIDTKEETNVITLSILPLISICDDDCKITTLDGTKSIQSWIIEQLTNNFVNTDDKYHKYNFEFVDETEEEIMHKAVDNTSNLLEVLTDIYLNTGIYIDFQLKYEENKAVGIVVYIYNANEQEVKRIRYDHPQIVDKITYAYSQYGNYSKVSIKLADKDLWYYFYLREDNKITTNPDDELRIKKVKNKNIEYTSTYTTEQELAEGLVLLAETELLGDAFAYSIEFVVLRSAITDWKFRQRCDFMAQDRLYQSYITQIEYIDDKQARVVLGAYRYTLTDKFKRLLRPREDIGSTFNGINVQTALGNDVYWFTQNDAGELVLNYEGDTPPNYSLNENGELIYTYDETLQNFNNRVLEIDEQGNLIYKY